MSVLGTCPECKREVDDARDYCVVYYSASPPDGSEISRVEHKDCADEIARREFKKTGRLSSSLTLSAQLEVMRAEREGRPSRDVDKEINDACERLRVDIKRFEAKAWFGGVEGRIVEHEYHGPVLTFEPSPDSLQSIVDADKRQTIETRLYDFSVSCQTMAGRVLIQMESVRGRITLIAAEHEQTARMGMQGIDGTEDECRRMLATVTDRWKELRFT